MPRLKRKSSGRMTSKGYPNPIDVHVGRRIRLRRTLLGISQQVLAESIGLTFQQVQKCESGANRVSSSRLVDIAKVLEVSIPYFFQEMSESVQNQTPSMLMNAKALPKADQDKKRSNDIPCRLCRLRLIAKARRRRDSHQLGGQCTKRADRHGELRSLIDAPAIGVNT
jgi:transcriptional regulator with XRE-family HTH domain